MDSYCSLVHTNACRTFAAATVRADGDISYIQMDLQTVSEKEDTIQRTSLKWESNGDEDADDGWPNSDLAEVVSNW